MGNRGCSELSERLDFGGTNETQELGELRRLGFWGRKASEGVRVK